jgi:hypothetical protein
MSEGAARPWVVVVGMHRSGTSAVSGAVGGSGLNSVRTEDRMSPHDSNSEHRRAFPLHCTMPPFLAHLGGTSDCSSRVTGGQGGLVRPYVTQRCPDV